MIDWAFAGRQSTIARHRLVVDFGRRQRDTLGMAPIIQVALGGALGASARYLTGLAVARVLGAGFPWGTLVVNVLGSFAMGVAVVMLVQLSATRLSPLLMSGLLGGFTTFSAFSLDAVTLLDRGMPTAAAAYVLASVLLSLAALMAGLTLARSFA